MKRSNSYHNYIDNNSATYQVNTINYQFFPHFHPYVAGNRAPIPTMQLSLIERLKDGGLAELQGSDTLYMPQPSPPAGQPMQPLSVISNSTRATLCNDTTATQLSDSSSLPLVAGTPLTLSDLTWVTVLYGTLKGKSFQLPGNIPASFPGGIQITGTETIVPDYTAVNLTDGVASAILTSDGSEITLPAGTNVYIRSGLPQPFFYEDIFDNTHYQPSDRVQQPFPVKDLDFTSDGAYSIYNWELFFHFPLLVAIHLSQNQKFKDAQQWFHYIFNPTDNSQGPTPERFWGVQPFQYTDVRMIQDILVNLSTGQDTQLYQQTVNSIGAWKQNPFQPWVVAKYRPTAYMLKTVMAYLDNLIAWGDSLFQQYTIETINEATQLYIMAANILGPKPQPVPTQGSVTTLTYNSLRGKLNDFGDALVDMEVDIPFDMTTPSGSGTPPNGSQILPSLGQTLYFCIPRNDKLLAYWDAMADRLFKIHNSLNLLGVFQRLPLYDPRIDPALLVRAAASGLHVSAVVSGLNQPLPLVRFQFLVTKATELCQEVKSLGANLLSAIEKQDNESIARLRAEHENNILQMTNVVRYSQWQEAQKANQALLLTLENAKQRYKYYQKLLGRSDAQINSSLPQLEALDAGSLQGLKFSQSDMSSEPQMTSDPITPDFPPSPSSLKDEYKTLVQYELEELNKLKQTGHIA